MNLVKALCSIGKATKRCAPTILSVAGAAGVVATGVAAAKAGRADMAKDIEASEFEYGPDEYEPPMERRKRKIKTYAKPIIFGAASIGCILAGDRLHAKRYIALGAAATIVQDRYDRLRKQLTNAKGIIEKDDGTEERHPEKGFVEGNVRSKMDAEEADRVYAKCEEAGIKPYDTRSGTDLWYEPWSKSWFLASESYVINAEYHLNRNMQLRGEAPFREFLSFLELPASDIPLYEKFHWNQYEGETYYGYTWVDFCHAKKHLPNGQEYYQIFYPFEPHLSEK